MGGWEGGGWLEGGEMSGLSRDLEGRFRYHPPKGDQAEIYDDFRSAARRAAYLIDDNCPDGREKSLAFTKLEEAVMWANASIARHGE